MLRQRALALFFVWLLLVALIGSAVAGDEPFTGAANWGGTGLMEIPNARVLREGRFRFGAAQADPYRIYSLAASPFKGLELDFRVTEVFGVPALLAGYGNTKDKALDLKYRFLPEGKWWPALAIGIMDPQGTRLYASQYIVASKQIYPFDFTVGFGNGRYGTRPLGGSDESFKAEIISDPQSWRREGQFFGGIEYAATESLSFMAEYNPIKYEIQTTDPAQAKYFTSAVPSKFNFGVRWRPWEWLETDLSWQRGNQLGVNISAAFDLGAPMIPLYDHPYKERPEHRLNPYEERIARGLEAVGFASIVLRRDGEELSVEAKNVKYYYTPRALGVMLRTVSELAPAEVKRLRLIIADDGLPVLAMNCTREDATLFTAEKLTVKQFLSLNPMDTGVSEGLPGKKFAQQWWDYGLKPSFRMFLNDPSGYFKYRLGIRGWVSLYPWAGGTFVTGLEYYPLNTVSSSNGPSSNPVRSDLVAYQQNNVALGILMLEQIEKFPHQIYGRLAGGILEIQYAGLDGEIATPLFGGRLMVGLSGSLVKKRDPDRTFAFKENDYKDTYQTAFLNTRLNIPEVEMALDLKTGQFLAGDRGTRVTLSKFFNGVILSVWYSQTNTDLFADYFNRGYHDKGVSITIPMRLFGGTDSRRSYGFGISPWTRDVAQDIDHFNTLFDYMGRNTKVFLEKDANSRGDGRSAGFR